ncbi:MAG: hypothetical protein AOA65_0241 [Candidatus Bathyarchaeota archaeon BA1]|nr:MAG: hypothetical protein AOA65_0241 [Candidatus Bathyarchaeota archaeon BA1]
MGLCGEAKRKFDLEKEAYWEMRDELLKKYEGKWIAIVRGRVVAVGDTSYDVVEKASKIRVCGPIYINKVGEEKNVVRRYRRYGRSWLYDMEYDPPAPVVKGKLLKFDESLMVKEDKLLLDTGSDGSALSDVICKSLNVYEDPIGVFMVSGIGVRAEERVIYRARVDIDGFRAIAHVDCRDDITEVVLGREVLNRFRIILDKGKKLTISE